MNNKNSRTNALPGLRKKNGPTSKSDGVRTDSTTRYDPITLKVDSTPVGQTKVNTGGYGFVAAIKGGNENASMWKSKRDQIATDKVTKSNQQASNNSKPGSGGMRPIMPGV